jgi:hypothetical protein
MVRLGIIGAENSHSYHIGKICNLDKSVPMTVPLIWGETDEFAKVAMEKGGIPAVVKDWREMLGRVDGVMIDHRHPAPHVEPARFFIERGVPVFVDKPFTYRLRDAKRLLDMAAKKRVPVTTIKSGMTVGGNRSGRMVGRRKSGTTATGTRGIGNGLRSPCSHEWPTRTRAPGRCA